MRRLRSIVFRELRRQNHEADVVSTPEISFNCFIALILNTVPLVVLKGVCEALMQFNNTLIEQREPC